jgi:2'-5' RNA ligase
VPGAGGALRTAISIVLDDALEPLEPIHRELHPVHAESAIPLHITLLYPFVSRSDLAAMHVSALERVCTAHSAFAFELAGLAAFPSVVYAVPRPDDELRTLMRAVWDAFPETPPYGGAFVDPPPHATLAAVPDGHDPLRTQRTVEARVGALLPLRCGVRDVALMEEHEPDRWRVARRFPLTAR